MIDRIAGSSHSKKTLLAQRLLEHRKIPCLSQDHLKMGLIRSKTIDRRVEGPGCAADRSAVADHPGHHLDGDRIFLMSSICRGGRYIRGQVGG